MQFYKHVCENIGNTDTGDMFTQDYQMMSFITAQAFSGLFYVCIYFKPFENFNSFVLKLS